MASVKKIYLRFFDAYSRFARRVSSISLVVAYVLLVVVTCIVLLSVFYRYILIDPIQWAEEISRYILIWMTLIAASVAIKERKHVNLISILIRLPQRIALLIDIFFYLIIVFIIGRIVEQSFIMVVTRSVKTLSASLQISMLWAHTALPVGFGLILIQAFYIILEDIALFITGESFKEKLGG